MGVMTVALRRADSTKVFSDVYMQSMTPLIKMTAESDETLDKALDKRLPEEVDTVPTTLVAGKMVSVKGVLYIGGPTGAPVKVTYSHPTSSGNKHLPAGGTKGQYLTNADGAGGGTWTDIPSASTTNAGIVQLSDGVTVADTTKAATANAVKKAYDKANHSHPYVPTSQVGAKGGVAPLDENGVISSTYLPSYVDDVIDGTINDDLSAFTDTDGKAVTPEAGKIYNDTTKNKSYRWSGTAYVSLNDGVALGETESTAYRGDRGKAAYDHSQSAHARTDATKTEKSSTNGNVKINDAEVTVYTHPTTAGNKHLPAAGTVNQYLKNTAAGTGAWESADTTPTADSVKLITSGAVAKVKSDLTTEIGKKADSTHTHTKTEVGLGNVDNKSSETIRSEITKKNVTDALGYTPVESVPGMTGATATESGSAGTVPAPAAGDNTKFLAGDGTWSTPKDTTYSDATQSVHGLMSTTDKKKLDGIADGATKVTVDSALSSTSTNPVQNKAVNTALGLKANKALSSLNEITVDVKNTTATSPNATAITATPFGKDLWHDHFAFLHTHTMINHQTTTDGTTWTDSTDNIRNLFMQKDYNSTYILGSAIAGRRFTLNTSQLSYSGLQWVEIPVAYTSPFAAFKFTIEYSTDGSTWNTCGAVTISNSQTPYYIKTSGISNASYLRFTFMKNDTTSTGTVALTAIKGFTLRKGDQGRGVEFEYPYDWDASRNIYPHSDNARILGSSTKRWKNVYAVTFNGALSGNATSATKATNDGKDQAIASTYIKGISAEGTTVTVTKGDGTTTTFETQDSQVTVSNSVTQNDTNPVSGGAVWTELAKKANASSLGNKQDKITGAATTVVSDDLTASRALVSDATGKIAAGSVTSTELGYLSGVKSKVQTQLDAKAPLASPALTGTPTAPTAASTTNNTQVATTAFVQAVVGGLMDAKDAFRFVGTLKGGDTLPAAESGHVYRITADGTINGLTVHEGDTITCCVDGTKAGTPANWFVTHTNHDGQVMGPTSAVDSHVAVYDGATGKLIKDSGFTIGSSVPANAKFTDTVYTHPTSGVTAASYGPSENVTPVFGAKFNVPYITVDANGHITAAATRTVKIPVAPTSVTGNAGTATKLATGRTIKFTGDVTGSFSFDGSADVSAALTAAVSSIKEQNGKIPTYMWIGTSAEYKALTQKYTETEDDTLYFVTDEEGTDNFMSGVKLNGTLLTLSSGVANINALTGITMDGVTVTTSKGVAALTTPKVTYNGATVSKTNDTFAIVDNIQSIKMNGTTVSPDSSHAVNLSAITSIKLGNTSMSVSNGAATLANMGRIFYGTDDPSSSTGANGDIYIKYST